MANIDAPVGMRPVKVEYGTAPKIEKFAVTDSVAIYQGAPVCLADTGLIVAYTNTLAAAGQVVGVASHYVSAAQADRTLLVYTDPGQVFEMQSDDATLTAVTDYRGGLFRFVNPAAGNTTTLQSKAEIDGSSGTSVTGATSTAVTPIRIEDVVVAPQNTIGSGISWTRFLVRFILPVHHRGMGKVGIANSTFTGIL